MLIILEGISGVGKSTVKHEYFAHYNDALIICRFTPSQFVYSQLKKRIGNMLPAKLLEVDEKMKDFSVFFHLTVSQDVLKGRTIRDDTDLDYSRIEQLYNDYYQMTPIPHEKINTTGMTPRQIVEVIRERVKKRGFL